MSEQGYDNIVNFISRQGEIEIKEGTKKDSKLISRFYGYEITIKFDPINTDDKRGLINSLETIIHYAVY